MKRSAHDINVNKDITKELTEIANNLEKILVRIGINNGKSNVRKTMDNLHKATILIRDVRNILEEENDV